MFVSAPIPHPWSLPSWGACWWAELPLCSEISIWPLLSLCDLTNGSGSHPTTWLWHMKDQEVLKHTFPSLLLPSLWWQWWCSHCHTKSSLSRCVWMPCGCCHNWYWLTQSKSSCSINGKSPSARRMELGPLSVSPQMLFSSTELSTVPQSYSRTYTLSM